MIDHAHKVDSEDANHEKDVESAFLTAHVIALAVPVHQIILATGHTSMLEQRISAHQPILTEIFMYYMCQFTTQSYCS